MTQQRQVRRPDYLPFVRDRGLRIDGLLPLSPARSKDTTDTKTKWYTSTISDTRATVLTPSAGKRLRIVRINLIFNWSAGNFVIHEFYFGTATNIASADRIVNAFRTAGANSDDSRTWTRGQGPIGNKDEVLSRRHTDLNASTVYYAIEYTEER